MLYNSPKLTHMIEGRSTELVRNGNINQEALKKESLTEEELLEAIHRQGFERLDQVGCCVLEPNGTFLVEPIEPSSAEKYHNELLARLDALTAEMAALRGKA